MSTYTKQWQLEELKHFCESKTAPVDVTHLGNLGFRLSGCRSSLACSALTVLVPTLVLVLFFPFGFVILLLLGLGGLLTCFDQSLAQIQALLGGDFELVELQSGLHTGNRS